MGSRRVALLALLSGLLGPFPAPASDGVLEINQACATGPGCFEGDTGGLPVKISAAGSYRLTSDLSVATTLDPAVILISASDVSLDLGGFAIQGPNVCTGVPPSCLFSTGVIGIRAEAGTFGTEIANGRVTGMGQQGILLGGAYSVIRDVTVAHNGLQGLNCVLSIVSNVLAASNGGNGVQASGSVATGISANSNQTGITTVDVLDRSSATGNVSGISGAKIMSDSSANSNTGAGFTTVDFHYGAIVLRSTANGNGAEGFSLGYLATISSSTASSNGGDGISLGGSTTTAVAATATANSVRLNGGDGIETLAHALVLGNTASDNTGAGLRLGEDSAYRENSITSNTGGTVVGLGAFQNTTGNFCTDAADNAVACP